uniref:Uncharacterized protein n=1 Tax=Heterorhabditis bacteriophora TaxID=37862 RepID=A0A1I7WUI4_HETBA
MRLAGEYRRNENIFEERISREMPCAVVLFYNPCILIFVFLNPPLLFPLPNLTLQVDPTPTHHCFVT